ncbi:hypothetical protein QUA20_02820 [Microcoleus sp. Pol7_A1]
MSYRIKPIARFADKVTDFRFWMGNNLDRTQSEICRGVGGDRT